MRTHTLGLSLRAGVAVGPRGQLAPASAIGVGCPEDHVAERQPPARHPSSAFSLSVAPNVRVKTPVRLGVTVAMTGCTNFKLPAVLNSPT